MTMHDLPWSEAPAPALAAGAPRSRLLAAALLRAAGLALSRLAERLLQAPAAASGAEPLLEFHAEAGAPEGALYVDGQLVAHLPGVQRL